MNKTYAEEIVQAVIRNYWSNYGTFYNIENIPGISQEIRDIENYYPYIGFRDAEELETLTKRASDSELSKTIGITVTSSVTKLIGEYLKGHKIGMIPQMNQYLGDLLTEVAKSDYDTKIKFLTSISKAGYLETVPSLYPEIVVDPSTSYEGIYMGKLYLKQETLLPLVEEVVAYMLDIKLKPSSMFHKVTEKLTANPHQMEMLDMTTAFPVYREIVIFANKNGLKVADIWNTLGLQYFDHSKTLKDSILIMGLSEGSKVVTFCLTGNSLQLSMRDAHFQQLYNEDLLTDITIVEATSDNLALKLNKGDFVMEMYLKETGVSLWKYLRLPEQPLSASNLTGM